MIALLQTLHQAFLESAG